MPPPRPAMRFVRSVSGWLLLTTMVCIAAPAGAQTFTDATRSSGADAGPQTSFGNPVWGDFDADGLLDLFVVNHGGPPSLLRNLGNGTFAKARPGSGIPAVGDRHGAAWGDFDNDGLPDLFVTIGAERATALGVKADQLYRNEGGGRFTDVAAAAGVENRFGRGRSANWVDYDRDGRLDLFVKNFATPNALFRNNGDGTFTDVAAEAGLAGVPGTISSWADYDKDGYPDLLVTGPAGVDQLWRNNGDGTFSDVTEIAGLGGRGNGAGIAWGDYNGDSRLDLYIARGRNRDLDWVVWDASRIVFSAEETGGQNGLDFTVVGPIVVDLYLNGCREPARVFLGGDKAPAPEIPATVTWQNAWGKPDYAVGVDLGFYVWKDFRGWHIRWNSDGRPNGEGPQTFHGVITTTGAVESVTWLKTPPPPSHGGGTLYRNNGDGTFTDVTALAGVATNTDNRAAAWGDADNDGHLDLYVVGRAGRSFLFRNGGNGKFTDTAAAAGVLAATGAHGEGAAWGDAD
ncbi:MAG TPA: VCBS repeat-containing protein, partial [Acidimicrobiia bacterium]|nr:VCBS repeat-containing protein [Acidimicrobiia bacterium]